MSEPALSSLSSIARPIGSIINVVELFEVHIDKNPVAIIKPSITLFLLVPMIRIVKRAILLCSWFVSIALATKKAPIIKITM